MIYWHRELPPLDQDPIGEHVVDARSDKIPYRHGAEDDMWQACERSLAEAAARRLEQEIRRLGGDCAHVTDEHVDSHHDEAAGTFELVGRYSYVLYRGARKNGRRVKAAG